MTNSNLPETLSGKFNWGAFLLTWIWGLGNKTYITLLIFVAGFLTIIPLVGVLIPLGTSIWFGIKGNEWAWQNKEWQSIEHFQDVQKKWTIAGLIVFVLGIISAMIFGSAFVLMFMSGMQG